MKIYTPENTYKYTKVRNNVNKITKTKGTK